MDRVVLHLQVPEEFSPVMAEEVALAYWPRVVQTVGAGR
jgi:hypothetical protein